MNSERYMISSKILFLFSCYFQVAYSKDETVVVGVGSSLAQSLNERALLTYSVLQQPEVSLRYSALNSEAGSCRIKDYYTYCEWDRQVDPYADFASTEMPLTEEDIQRWPDLLQMPAVAAGIVPVYNLENYDPFAPRLILDRGTLVGIFSGNITMWDDHRIRSLQSESVASRLPSTNINVIVREDVSGSTNVMKEFLSRSSSSFAETTGSGGSPDWPGITTVRKYKGNAGVATGVKMTMNSIGYCDLATAKRLEVATADIRQETGEIVQADLTSIEYAMFERGVELDDNNQADLVNAWGDRAWPLTTYSYAIMRTNSLGDRMRVGADCQITQETSKYWHWFYTSDLVDSILQELYVVSLAKNTRNDILDDLGSKVWCAGTLVQSSTSSGIETGELLMGYGARTSDTLMTLGFQSYQTVNIQTELDYSPNRTNEVELPLRPNEAWRVVVGNKIFEQEWFMNWQYNEMHELIAGNDTYVAMPWYLMPLRVIYTLPSSPNEVESSQLVLDKELLRGILKGEVTTWDHPMLVLWNPWLSDLFFEEPMTLIELEDPMDVVNSMLAELLEMGTYENVVWNEANRLESYSQVAELVQLTPGAIAVIPYVSTSGSEPLYAALNFYGSMRDSPVSPSIDSLSKCIGPNSYNPTTFEFEPNYHSGGESTGCYPLTLPVYIVMWYSYKNSSYFCTDDLSPGWQTTGFLRFLFLSGQNLEESFTKEAAFPLNFVAGSESHMVRVQDVMTFMPCGFQRDPEEEGPADILLQAAMYAGVLFACILCCCIGCMYYYQRRKHLLMNPLYGINVQKVLEQVYYELIDVTDGQVATYIPELGNADPEQFGIALMKVDGQCYSVGDANVPFTIQSISKPFIYAFCLLYNGDDYMETKVGMEPSGGVFNSEKLNEEGKPFNPFINQGAIACCGVLCLGDGDCRYEMLTDFMNKLSFSGQLIMDPSVYYSECGTADQNRLIGKVLLEAGIIESEYDMEHGLESYFMSCSTNVDCVELATMAAVLANEGIHPMSRLDVLSEQISSAVTSVMMTCGMYNGAGNWMVNVGIPAKSGVSGGIMAVVPGVCGLSVFSPRLDAHGNSVRGMEVCACLSKDLGLHTLGGKGNGKDRSNASQRDSSKKGSKDASVSRTSGSKK